MTTLKLTAELIPEEEGGFTVYCPELDIYTQGETEDECLANLREAAELHLEETGARSPCDARRTCAIEVRPWEGIS